MDTQKNDFLYPEITYKVRGSIFKVYNTLGFGHKEKIYHKALAIEFGRSQITFKSEPLLKVKYLEESIGVYRPDFLIENKIVVEIKAVEYMPLSFEKQLIHYLKTTDYKIGLLINFGTPEVLIKRLIWSGHYQR